jgi:hypothetical protein
MRSVQRFFVKFFLEFVNLLFNNTFFAFLSRRLNLFQALFLVYPAERRFAEHFEFSFRIKKNKTSPFIIGFCIHPNWKMSLCVAVSSTQRDFSEGVVNLKLFHKNVLSFSRCFGCKTTHLAGELPSLLKRAGVSREEVEREVTVAAVTSSCVQIASKHGVDIIVVLGSAGYIGKKVCESLEYRGLSVVGVDLGETFPSLIEGKRALVVNVASKQALDRHMLSFRGGFIFLNEVYPAPTKQQLQDLKERDVKAFHISGGRVKLLFPPLPGEYQGALPCCGMLQGISYELKIRVL